MNWLGGGSWAVHFHELELFVRRLRSISRNDPAEELPDVEISEHEQQGALRRAAAGRWMQERV